jgi:hypothetical protein
MSRFSSVVLAVALAGCAAPAPAPADPASLRLCASLPNAFGVSPGGLKAAPQELRQKLDEAELLGADFVDFPATRLLPDGEPAPVEQLPPLVSILREFVAPGQWEGRTLDVKDGELVARHAPEVLAAVQSALKTLRDHRGRMVRSMVRMQALPADALAGLENIPPAGGGLAGTFDRQALLGMFGAAHGALHAPSVTTFHGQKSHVMFLSQKAYVAGYSGEATEPVLSIATEGIVAELRTVANGTRPDEFLLSFDVQVASPTEIVEVKLGAGIVQMPAQGFARLSGRCALRSDQALLLVARNPDVRQADRPIVALTVTLDWAE